MTEIKNFEYTRLDGTGTGFISIVCGPVIFHEGKVFLVQSSSSQEWKFPGGNHHDTESEQDTVVRETREETTMTVEIIAGVPPLILKLSRTKDQQEFEYLLYHYPARFIGPLSIELSAENQDWGLFDPAQLPANCAPNIAIAVEHFQKLVD